MRKTKHFFIGLALISFLMSATSLFATVSATDEQHKEVQQTKKKVSGTVTDDSGALIGVTVSIPGTSQGTLTDVDGNYSIDVAQGNSLEFSYIGYAKRTVVIKEQTTLNIKLSEDSELLDEVVVVGYGSQKKSDITGAMVNVKSSAIVQAPVANIASALQGLAAGVDVQMAGGNNHPGAVPQIRIRGERSLTAGNDVLIVVDGIPFAGNLNDISNDDIESVSVLKDASSTAIYGSRGANGVILITTKRGSKGRINVNYSGYYGITSALKNFNLMGRDDYMKLKQWAHFNSSDPAKDGYTGPEDPKMMVVGKVFRDQEEMDGYYAGNDTDWQDLIFKNGMTTNHQLSIQGGGEKSTYSASIGYYKGENNYRGHNFERLNAKFSLDSDIKSYLKVGLSSINTFSKNKGQDVNPMDHALRASPFTTPYKEDGSLRLALPGSGQNVWNPLLDEKKGMVVDDRKTLSTFISGYGEVIFPLGFKYRLNGGIQLRNHTTGKFQATNTTKRMGGLNWAFSESNFRQDYTLENIISWNKTIKKVHNFDVVGLFSFQDKKFEVNNIDSNDYYDDNIQHHNPGLAQSGVKGSGLFQKEALVSWMGRLNYNYAEKYLLTATLRHDGSSVLADGNKWHSFPSVALGWNIIREKFVQDMDYLSGLKLRASWGNVGSAAIGPYQTMALLNSDKYMLGNAGVMGVYPSRTPDKSLGWENTETINFGLDFGFLSNRITGTLEVYQQKTTDLLLEIALPATSGYNRHVTNLGATRNRGIEFNVSTINLDGDGHDKLQWTTDFNIFANRNKITDLGPGVKAISDKGFYLGEDRFVIFSLEADGLWQDTPEDRALAESYGYKTSGPTSVIGDIKIKNHHIDYEDDGVTPKAKQQINDDDRAFIGRRAPDFEGGINNRFMFKGFDLSFLFTFKYGGTLTSDMHNGWMNTMQGGYNNLNIDYWTPENTSARWPKPMTGSISNKGLLARYDASYLKLRNLTVGYTLPKPFLNEYGINSARVYFTAANVWTWFDSQYRKDGGIDPETTSTVGLVTPPTQSFVFGVNLSF